jgi:cytosine/adenosine deaminase-related metal-dependent hydrolase
MSQTGTIEPGKQADILILSANPVEDIENTKRIDAVISNGRIIQRVHRLTSYLYSCVILIVLLFHFLELVYLFKYFKNPSV